MAGREKEVRFDVFSTRGQKPKSQHFHPTTGMEKKRKSFDFSYSEPQHPPSHIIREIGKGTGKEISTKTRLTESHQQGLVPCSDLECAAGKAGRRVWPFNDDLMGREDAGACWQLGCTLSGSKSRKDPVFFSCVFSSRLVTMQCAAFLLRLLGKPVGSLVDTRTPSGKRQSL